MHTTGFGMAQIKKEGSCVFYDTNTARLLAVGDTWGVVRRRTKSHPRNYRRPLKNGKGLSQTAAVLLAHYGNIPTEYKDFFDANVSYADA